MTFRMKKRVFTTVFRFSTNVTRIFTRKSIIAYITKILTVLKYHDTFGLKNFGLNTLLADIFI